MTESYKIQSKITNAIVFLAGLITYLGVDNLAKVMPKELAYLAPIIVMIAGYIAVQATENKRVQNAEKIIEEQYTDNEIGYDDIDPASEYSEPTAGDNDEGC